MHPLEDGKTMEWALRKRRKNTRSSEKQIRFLVDMYKEGEKNEKKKDVATVADMTRHAQGADQQKLFSPAEYLRREQILSFFRRITASRRRNMSFKDMLGQGSDTDYDIEVCLEELEAEQDLAVLKEQMDDLERNELDAEDTSVTTFGTTRTLSHAREIEVYPDSCCMFRAVAVRCDMELQSV